MMPKPQVTSQMKGQDKVPEKQLNELMIGNLPEKKKEKNQKNESKADPGSRKKSEGKD